MAESSSTEPKPPELPVLPVITLEPWEQRSRLEKYGSFFYVALAGLVLLLGMIGWFAWGVWSLREVWRDVYVLHDAGQSEEARVNAADRLAQNPDTTPRQLYDISLRRDLPDLARYLVAEALTAEAAADDPRAFALAVSRSEGWPDWLRLLHLRPLAYGSGSGEAIEPDPLRELAERPDPILRLWALYTLAESSRYNRNEDQALRSAANEDGPNAELATLLVEALDAGADDDRLARLDEATEWVRSHHPGAVDVWSGWNRSESGLLRVAPKTVL